EPARIAGGRRDAVAVVEPVMPGAEQQPLADADPVHDRGQLVDAGRLLVRGAFAGRGDHVQVGVNERRHHTRQWSSLRSTQRSADVSSSAAKETTKTP